MPPLWIEHVNPEGSRYFVNNSGTFAIVTDTPIRSQELWLKLFQGIQSVHALIENAKLCLQPTSELYIRVCGNNSVYDYYFVDHETQTEFWLEDVNAEALDLPEYTSNDHLSEVLTLSGFVCKGLTSSQSISSESIIGRTLNISLIGKLHQSSTVNW